MQFEDTSGGRLAERALDVIIVYDGLNAGFELLEGVEQVHQRDEHSGTSGVVR